jgi:hypothetical protein
MLMAQLMWLWMSPLHLYIALLELIRAGKRA